MDEGAAICSSSVMESSNLEAELDNGSNVSTQPEFQSYQALSISSGASENDEVQSSHSTSGFIGPRKDDQAQSTNGRTGHIEPQSITQIQSTNIRSGSIARPLNYQVTSTSERYSGISSIDHRPSRSEDIDNRNMEQDMASEGSTINAGEHTAQQNQSFERSVQLDNRTTYRLSNVNTLRGLYEQPISDPFDKQESLQQYSNDLESVNAHILRSNSAGEQQSETVGVRGGITETDIDDQIQSNGQSSGYLTLSPPFQSISEGMHNEHPLEWLRSDEPWMYAPESEVQQNLERRPSTMALGQSYAEQLGDDVPDNAIATSSMEQVLIEVRRLQDKFNYTLMLGVLIHWIILSQSHNNRVMDTSHYNNLTENVSGAQDVVICDDPLGETVETSEPEHAQYSNVDTQEARSHINRMHDHEVVQNQSGEFEQQYFPLGNVSPVGEDPLSRFPSSIFSEHILISEAQCCIESSFDGIKHTSETGTAQTVMQNSMREHLNGTLPNNYTECAMQQNHDNNIITAQVEPNPPQENSELNYENLRDTQMKLLPMCNSSSVVGGELQTPRQGVEHSDDAQYQQTIPQCEHPDEPAGDNRFSLTNYQELSTANTGDEDNSASMNQLQHVRSHSETIDQPSLSVLNNTSSERCLGYMTRRGNSGFYTEEPTHGYRNVTGQNNEDERSAAGAVYVPEHEAQGHIYHVGVVEGGEQHDLYAIANNPQMRQDGTDIPRIQQEQGDRIYDVDQSQNLYTGYHPYPIPTDVAIHNDRDPNLHQNDVMDVDIARNRMIRRYLRCRESCVTCTRRPRQAVNMPCLCVCYCMDCVTIMGRCALCRRPIEDFSERRPDN